MKYSGLLFFSLLISFLTFGQTKTIYTCPMHPQIQRSGPGNCPLCGMTLVKKTIKVPAKKPAQKPPAKKPTQPVQTQPDPVKPKPVIDTVAKEEDKPIKEDEPREEEPEIQTAGSVNIKPGKTVTYHLYVRDTMVNYTGRSRRAIAINGSIPAPTLFFTEGDSAEIYLHNQLNEETSLHWHGVILPNQADGVPFLTTKPIFPGDVHVYKFKVVQNGTYWYHSHSALQEQSGMYGALIFRKAGEPSVFPTSNPDPVQKENFRKEYTLVLSEWTDDNPMQVQRRLRTGSDWFAIKKGSTQSYSEAIKAGHFKTKLINEWKRMEAMDVSDVFYDRFLSNGLPESIAKENFKAGDRVRLHVVNAGASSYFWLGYGGGKFDVVGHDGNEVVPVPVDRLIIAPSETVDVEFEIPENMQYEFRATAEDRTGYSSLWFGSGMKMPAPTLPRLKYFEGMKMMNDMMNLDGTMNDMGMQMSLQKMDMNSVMYPELTGDMQQMDPDSADHNMNNMDHSTDSTDHKMDSTNHDMNNMDDSMHMSSGDIVTLNYDMLRAPVKTILPETAVRRLHFTLTGNMNRYVWTLDNKTVTETDRIMINRGENVRLVLTNNSMMRHPMHLHGHDFRVINSHEQFAPLKNVIDVMPMETDSIEFAANQDGNWFFHCHILYHMMAGMGRVFRYNNSAVNPELPDAEAAFQKFRRHKDQRMKHLMVRAGIETNGSDGEAMVSTNRYALQQIWHLGYSAHHGWESETMIGRYFGTNQWWFIYGGFDFHYKEEESKNGEEEKNMFGQVSNKNDRKTFVVGAQYLLPWLVVADGRVDGNGKFRFQLTREDIPLTPRLRFNLMGNTDKEYMVGFRYIISKWFSLSTHYDSDMGLGVGVTLSY